MERWKWLFWNRGVPSDAVPREPEPFSLPSLVREWPQGGRFAKGIICIGELEVLQVPTHLELSFFQGKVNRSCFLQTLRYQMDFSALVIMVSGVTNTTPTWFYSCGQRKCQISTSG